MKLSEWLVATAIVLVMQSTVEPVSAEQRAAVDTTAGYAWKFRVFLDDEEIGFHHFYLAEAGDIRQLRSVADFEYRLLFIPVYRYAHENTEIWQGDCLQSINSRTDANGENYRVDGRRSNGSFRVATAEGEQTLPECVMSFAYWNPAFIGKSRLLNTQDGKFLDVDFLPPVLEEREIRGVSRPAWRHALSAGELKMNLWYSDNGEWLGLESEVRGGRTLRYELDPTPSPETRGQDPNRTTTLVSTSAVSRKGL